VPDGVTGYVVPAANQPVLYTGPNYLADFYRWFKHPELLDLPLVPVQISGDDARGRFALQTDTIRNIPRTPIVGDCKVTSHLEQESITFDTTCPGRPHIVKVSYFPRWRTSDGSPIDLVSPGFMLVTPSSTHFEMVYSETGLDWFALATTWAGLLWAGAAVVNGRVRRGTTKVATSVFGPPWRAMQPARVRIPLNALLIVGCVVAGAAVRYQIRDVDSTFREGQAAFQERRFEDVVRVFSEFVREDSDRPKIATALLQLGTAYSELGQSELAIATLERLRFEFPNIDYGAHAGYHLVRNRRKTGDREQAAREAVTLERDYAESSWAKRTRKEFPDLFPPLVPAPAPSAPAASVPVGDSAGN